jgi:Transposase domain (DUF772)
LMTQNSGPTGSSTRSSSHGCSSSQAHWVCVRRRRRSSRVIERACVDDVAFRVIAANQRPDHCTIARFRQRHEAALAALFGEVLELCAEAGLVGVAVLAVDGTKVHANASQHQNLDYDEIAREVLAEANAVDRAEDDAQSYRPAQHQEKMHLVSQCALSQPAP